MNQLSRLQAEFQEYVCEGNPAMADNVAIPNLSTVDTRLGIYANAYSARLLEALADNFPMLQALLGDEQFASLGQDYLKAHPSRHFSVRWFGEALADFIAAQAIYKEYLVIGEMAAFEWAMTLAFDARDVDPMRIAEIAAISPDAWPEMVFTLHPSVQTLSFFTNAPAVWQALQQDNAPPEATVAANAARWIIWRQDLMIYFRRLGENEIPGFAAMRAAQNFSAICSAFVAVVDENEAASHAARVVQQWISDGLITAPAP